MEIQDKSYRNALLAQISSYGQTPHQLFKESHPMKDYTKPKAFSLRPKDLFAKNFEKLDCNIIAVYKIKKGARIITANRKMFNLSLSVEVFTPEKVIIKKLWSLGKFLFNEFNPQSNFYHTTQNILRPQLLQSQPSSNSLFIVVGFTDNSIKIYKGDKQLTKLTDHKKIITCVSCSEESDLFVLGSKDCRISLWKINKKNQTDPFKKVAMIYGHQNEVVAIRIDGQLGIIVSADKDGICMIHSIFKGRYLRSFQPALGEEEVINIINIHPNGLIVFSTTENQILLYKLVEFFSFYIIFVI